MRPAPATAFVLRALQSLPGDRQRRIIRKQYGHTKKIFERVFGWDTCHYYRHGRCRHPGRDAAD